LIIYRQYGRLNLTYSRQIRQFGRNLVGKIIGMRPEKLPVRFCNSGDHVMKARCDKTKLAILKVLQRLGGPAGSTRIMEELIALGIDLQPRTVRFYLGQLDAEGLTRFVSRRQGREITGQGAEELEHANVVEKIGFVAARVDSLGYRMSFDLTSGTGTIITNVAIVHKGVLSIVLREVHRIFAKGLTMGYRMALAHEGETLAGVKVPPKHVAIGTVCSVTINGILLDCGVPVTSRYGGLVELDGGQPQRFVQLIDYQGTTLDPLEIFIKANMTQVHKCAETNRGIIGASFREVPSVALSDVRRIRQDIMRHGLDGILSIGKPNLPLLDMPVAEGRAGMIVIGGLNPIAALYESGVRLSICSLVGLEEIDRFVPYQDLTSG